MSSSEETTYDQDAMDSLAREIADDQNPRTSIAIREGGHNYHGEFHMFGKDRHGRLEYFVLRCFHVTFFPSDILPFYLLVILTEKGWQPTNKIGQERNEIGMGRLDFVDLYENGLFSKETLPSSGA